mmetsp:Transcript_20017/g.35711  ORF Transcript_20017/g.35711 Transcript_20017/m.35711 type:complete len:261 (-) Transcript_20017:1460-2242(-)
MWLRGCQAAGLAPKPHEWELSGVHDDIYDGAHDEVMPRASRGHWKDTVELTLYVPVGVALVHRLVTGHGVHGGPWVGRQVSELLNLGVLLAFWQVNMKLASHCAALNAHRDHQTDHWRVQGARSAGIPHHGILTFMRNDNWRLHVSFSLFVWLRLEVGPAAVHKRRGHIRSKARARGRARVGVRAGVHSVQDLCHNEHVVPCGLQLCYFAVVCVCAQGVDGDRVVGGMVRQSQVLQSGRVHKALHVRCVGGQQQMDAEGQ